MSSWAGFDEFLAIAQTGSFRYAAARLGCSPSQVSREIAALEDRLGARLFYRTTRHVSLTEAGQQFLTACRRIVEERDEAVTALLEEGTELQGLLRMTSSVAYGERFVIPIVTQVMAENPRLNVDIRLCDEVLDIVDEGIDLAVRFGNLRDSRLVATRLASRMRLVCASPQYLAEHGAPQTLEDLSSHSCLRGLLDTWTFAGKGRNFVHRPQGRFKSSSGYSALEAALRGMGLCRLPHFYVAPHLASGELIEVLPDYRGEDEGVWAVYPNRKHSPMKVRVMIDRLRSGLALEAMDSCRWWASGRPAGSAAPSAAAKGVKIGA